MNADVSPDFVWKQEDAEIFKRILEHEATPEAIKTFAAHCSGLSDYAYWFGLSTLWVSYTGFSDLELWRRLFSSDRPGRTTGLMKPSEVEVFSKMPEQWTIYRAHRPGEQDWIAYTISVEKAAFFALRRKVTKFSEYRIAKQDVLCLFLRREEFEALVLDKEKATFIREITIQRREHGQV